MDPFRHSQSFDFNESSFPSTGNNIQSHTRFEFERSRELLSQSNPSLSIESPHLLNRQNFAQRTPQGFVPYANTRGIRGWSGQFNVDVLNYKPSTLFIGDLSVMCNEEAIYELFHPYGQIESIQLKKSERDPQRAHLGYGFIKFSQPEAASRALQELNGIFFLGRNLRVGWADGGSMQHGGRFPRGQQNFDQKKLNQTAQIHVMFVSKDLSFRISEMNLRMTFERFGNLVDIAIKKNVLNEEMGVQSGYGFVHYALTEDGIHSAVAAVEAIDRQTVDRVSYQCKVTHSLQAHIYSLKYNPQKSSFPQHTPMMAPPYPAAAPVIGSFPPPRSVFHRLPPDAREPSQFSLPYPSFTGSMSMDSYDASYHSLVSNMNQLLLTSIHPLEQPYGTSYSGNDTVSPHSLHNDDYTTGSSTQLLSESREESTIRAISPAMNTVLSDLNSKKEEDHHNPHPPI